MKNQSIKLQNEENFTKVALTTDYLRDLPRKVSTRGLRPTRSLLKAKMLKPKSCLPQAVLKSKY